jgi:hypothetical protein
VSNPLSENIIFTTLAIEDDVAAPVGTGFLVADTPSSTDEYGRRRITWDRYSARAYLVTARHVLGANASEISIAKAGSITSSFCCRGK